MYGWLDISNKEWTDGIFSQLWRKANRNKKIFTWLTLDGPIDAVWVENRELSRMELASLLLRVG